MNKHGKIIILLLVVVAVLFGFEHAVRLVMGVKPAVELGQYDVGGYLPSEVAELTFRLARELAVDVRDATIDRETGRILAEQAGIEVDVEQTIRQVLAAGVGEHVEPVITVIRPAVSADDLRRLNITLGEYSTWLAGSPSRINNIRVAARLINNVLLRPGEIFSFNGTVGPRTPEKGFRYAPVIVGESSVPGVGGGVCQVSTTVYNAARRANMQIIERYRHSRSVDYVPRGYDAAVAYDYLDLKFRNVYTGPVLLKSSVSGSQLTVYILGDGRFCGEQ